MTEKEKLGGLITEKRHEKQMEALKKLIEQQQQIIELLTKLVENKNTGNG